MKNRVSGLLAGVTARQLALAIAVGSLGSTPALSDTTLPSGGTVSAGSASIGTAGSAMTINQASQRAVIRWNSFSIGSDASVTFNQPNSTSIALNRVLGNDLSRIDGQLNANGQVFITNPNGVLFGAGSQVNVGGLVASTLEMDEAAFMGGNFVLQGNSTATVTNEGSLNGQNVALVGARIINTGNITADSAVLAAGERVTLQFDGDGLINASVDAKQLNAFIENGGVISVGEGRLLMTAGTASELTSTVINNTGILQANSLTSQGGDIVLGGDYLVNTGSIEANGQSGGNITLNADRTLMAGDIKAEGTQQGGAITTATRRHRETQSATQSVNGEVAGTIQLTAQLDLFSSGTYTADGDTGGAIDITAQNIELRGATVTATGAGDGGHIRIGGGYQGKDADIQNATTNTIANTTIDASSTDNGNGGTVIVWSDVQTDFYGTAKATGGTNSGDGGFIEVSGKELLNFGGTGDASAANGEAGTLLLDPKNIVIDASVSAGVLPSFLDFADPSPAADEKYGLGVYVLENGNIAVASPNDDYAAQDAGSVALYDALSGSLLGLMTGRELGDRIGSGGVASVGESHYLFTSRYWSNGGATNAGSITKGSAYAGISGIVSEQNSLVGSRQSDGDSMSLIHKLANGNFVISMRNWDWGPLVDAGAVIWGSADLPMTGFVSPDNALVGNHAGDKVGGISVLSNGNYVVLSPGWNGGLGAATWVDGNVGLVGEISASNSLVGSPDFNGIGSNITLLENGNYVLRNIVDPNWGRSETLYGFPPLQAKKGAVTWGDASAGVTGIVGELNSLLGSSYGDNVGSGKIEALPDGNYLVISNHWDQERGAVTWVDGLAGMVGFVSENNSLVGRDLVGVRDNVGSGGITILPNGNYLISSLGWGDVSPPMPDCSSGICQSPTPVLDFGAVTWADAGNPVTGTVSELNSLTGSYANQRLGDDIYVLSNGNYLVRSANTVTWADAFVGVIGEISEFNSLIGTGRTTGPGGSGGIGMPIGGVTKPIIELTNGNFVIISDYAGKGAVTWVDGTKGVSGFVSEDNSLVGVQADDRVGNYSQYPAGYLSGELYNSVIPLANGNYVVISHKWDNGSVLNAGAVTWGDGINGTVGFVSASNSLVGSQANDKVGVDGIVRLANSNYVVKSFSWDSGTLIDAGAVTWRNGSAADPDVVSISNSLIGDENGPVANRSGSILAIPSVIPLANGNYIVATSTWDNGATVDVGAVTWGSGVTGISGVISPDNSLIGSLSGEKIGGFPAVLPNGNYVIYSHAYWDGGLLVNSGAVLLGDGLHGTTGVMSTANALVGVKSYLGNNPIYVLSDGNYAVVSSDWDNGSVLRAGAVTWIDGDVGLIAEVSSANSLVGSSTDDRVGKEGILDLGSGRFLVRSPDWDNGALVNAGALTWVDSGFGAIGEITASNSLVGSFSSAKLGEYGAVHLLNNGEYYYAGIFNNQDRGYLVIADSATGVTGEISLENAIIPDVRGDMDAVKISLYLPDTFLIAAPNWDSGGLINAGRVFLWDKSGVLGNTYSGRPGSIAGLPVQQLADRLSSGGKVLLQANNDITINSDIIVNNPSGNGGSFTLQAGRNITFNANVFTDNGNLTAIAGDPSANPAYRDAGTPTITIGSGVNLNAGEGVLTLAAIGGDFINNSGPDAITTSGVGYWHIYSSHPDNNTFGGLNSGNQALWNMVYGDVVSAGGNRYIFEYQPTLNFTTIDGQKKGIRAKNINNLYAANGFVDASLYGNVFTQDTVDNSLSGAPNLYSQGAEAWQKAGNYPITFQDWGTLAATNGYALGSFSDGSNLNVRLSFIDKIRLKIHNILERFRQRRQAAWAG